MHRPVGIGDDGLAAMGCRPVAATGRRNNRAGISPGSVELLRPIGEGGAMIEAVVVLVLVVAVVAGLLTTYRENSPK